MLYASRRLTFFVTDKHPDADVMGRVPQAVGLCLARLRRLLADPSASWLMPQVHEAALRGGARLLTAGECQPGSCPSCLLCVPSGVPAFGWVHVACCAVTRD
jgi:hypothetical protein